MSKSDYTFEFASIISDPALAANEDNVGAYQSPLALATEATCNISRSDLAKHLYEMRRKRDKFLPAELFAEPAWDILLLLYWAGARQQRMSVSAVCVSAGVPDTTALRWIQKLQLTGLVDKTRHPTDIRVSWLTLTVRARAAIDNYLTWVIDNN